MRRLAIVLGLVGLPACGDPPPGPDPADAGPGPGDAAPAPSGEATPSLAIDPLDAADECLSRSRAPVVRALRRFDDALGDDGRPRKRTSVVALSPVDDELAACPTLPEDTDADLAAAHAAYVGALRSVADLLAQLVAYHRDGEHPDDDGAKSEQLAPQLREAVATWSTAADTLQATVQRMRDAEDASHLRTLGEEASGSLAHRAAQTFEATKDLHRCVVDDTTTDDPTTRCADAREALGETLEALAVARRRDPDETAAVFWFDAFDASLIRYTTEIDAALQPRKKAPKPEQLAATREALTAAFALVTRDYRRLDFSFPS